jgi:hypothetical protein
MPGQAKDPTQEVNIAEVGIAGPKWHEITVICKMLNI